MTKSINVFLFGLAGTLTGGLLGALSFIPIFNLTDMSEYAPVIVLFTAPIGAAIGLLSGIGMAIKGKYLGIGGGVGGILGQILAWICHMNYRCGIMTFFLIILLAGVLGSCAQIVLGKRIRLTA